MTKYLTLAFLGQIFVLMISTQCYPLGPPSSPFGHTASLNHGSFFPLKQYHNWPHSSSRNVITGKQQTLTLNVTGLNLFCSKSQCHSHHKECRLEVNFSLFSEGISGADLDAAICCKARLGYRTSHGFELQSESSSEKICHLHQGDFNKQNQVFLRFAFSDYEEVVDADLESIECRIESVEIDKKGIQEIRDPSSL